MAAPAINFTPDAAPAISFTPDQTSGTTDFEDDDSPEAMEAKALGGGAENVAALATGGAGAVAGAGAYLGTAAGNALRAPFTSTPGRDPLDVAQEAQNALTYQPRGAPGQAAQPAIMSPITGAGRALTGAANAIDPTGTLADVGTRALTVAPALAPVAGAARSMLTSTSRIANFGDIASDARTPPKVTPGPITPEELKSEPARLPQAAQETQTPTQGAAPSAPAPAAPAAAPATPKFTAPAQEGTVGQALPQAAQDARAAALSRLNADTNGMLPEHRVSALTGDYAETGNDFQYAKGEDEGGQKIKDTINQENLALRTASEHTTDPALTGGAAEGTGRPALSERGTTIDNALQGIGNWFDDSIKQQYAKADAAGGGIPITKFDELNGMMNDHSQFSGVDGRQFHSDMSQVMDQFGMRGQDGFWKPTTAATAERFRQWVSEQGANPRLARTVSRVKDALDSDVASHGGQGLYEQGRALRFQRDQMLEGPNGIRQLMSVDRYGNRGTEVADIPDKIANMGESQFNHVVNVLHDSAKLGNGELAEGSANALNEIRGHMAARLHEAGTANADRTWNAGKYYNKLNAYSLKLPKVFSGAGMERFGTINEAGNALRMDKSYPGAGAQIQKLGIGNLLRDRIAHTVEGAATGALGPIGGAVMEMVGGGKAVRSGVSRILGGGSESSRAAALKARVQPLGQRVPGQGGWIGNRAEPGDVEGLGKNYPVLNHEYDKETGEHQVHSPGGGLTVADDVGPHIRVLRDDTPEEYQRQGHSVARQAKLVDTAAARGGRLQSDYSISPAEAAVYEKMKAQGFDVQKNPNTVVNPGTGNIIDNSGSRTPVYSVGPKPVTDTRPLGSRIPGQRGGPKFTPPAEPAATVNIGLHQGTEGQPGFRKMSKQEAVKALESTGAKVGKTSVLTPEKHGVAEPTLVADTDRALNPDEMQGVLARTKQSAIPQQVHGGEGEMHVAPGHEAVAKEQGWDSFSPDYFREHNGKTQTENATSFNPEELEKENFTPHPSQTVKNPIRNAYPGIYDKVKDIMSRVKTEPEDPIMKQLFGKTRKDLHDDALAHANVEQDYRPPGVAAKAKGSKAAKNVMTDENAARLRDTISAFKESHPEAYHGMVGWYEMQALYDKVKEHVGAKLAPAVYDRLNHLIGMSSSGSDVVTEINRGTGANMMHAQGKFDQFAKHGGTPEAKRGKNFPPELEDVKGHAYHSTAHVKPMQHFLNTGESQMESPKVPTYIRSSAAQGQGFQNRVLVGDSHWSRGVGLADTRTAEGRVNKQGVFIKGYNKSVSNPELSDLHPWYRSQVADKVGLPATSAQAVQWGALSHETGVNTAIGAPKLEIFAQQVAKAAKRMNVTPEEALKRIIKGMAHAG